MPYNSHTKFDSDSEWTGFQNCQTDFEVQGTQDINGAFIRHQPLWEALQTLPQFTRISTSTPYSRGVTQIAQQNYHLNKTTVWLERAIEM